MIRRMIPVAAWAIAAVLLTTASAWCRSCLVTDCDGKPIASAKIYATNAQKPLAKPIVYQSDAEGQFAYEPAEKVRHNLVYEAKGYAYAVVNADPNKEDQLVIRLWPEKELRGSVVDEKGLPIQGATVWMRGFWGWNQQGNNFDCRFGDDSKFAGRATTDAKGKFVIRKVADYSKFEQCNVQICSVAPGRALVEKNLYSELLGGDIKIINMPGCCLSGTVYLPKKAGPAPKDLGLVVSFSSPSEGIRQRSIELDRNGKFFVRGLPPGPVNIMLDNQAQRMPDSDDILKGVREWALPVANVELSPGKCKDLDLVMVTGALVRGKIVDKVAGKPIAQADIRVDHAGRTGELADGIRINKNGEFALRVAPGEVSLSLRYCQIDKDWISFDSDGESPNCSFTAANGDEKMDVVLNVTEQNRNSVNYEAIQKPIPDDFELKCGQYQLDWDPQLRASGSIWMGPKLDGDKARQKIAKVPALKSKKSLFQAYKLDGPDDDGLFFVVFDESKGTGAGYDMAYVDINRNRDLSDDEPIKWRSKSNYSTTTSAEVRSHQGMGAERTNHPLTVSWMVYSNRPQQLVKKGGWKGLFDTNKGPVQVIMLDADGDGIYSNKYKCDNVGSETMQYNNAVGDCIYADTNGVGKAMPDRWCPHVLTQGGVNMLGGKGYVLSANAVGDKITVEPYTGRLGTLVVKSSIGTSESSISAFSLNGEPRFFNIQKPDGQPLTLPVGKYALSSVSMVCKTGKGSSYIYGQSNLVIQIKPDEQATVDISGKPHLNIYPQTRNLILKPGEETTVAWDMTVGDTLKSVSLNDDTKNPLIGKITFDSGTEALDLKPRGGG